MLAPAIKLLLNLQKPPITAGRESHSRSGVYVEVGPATRSCKRMGFGIEALLFASFKTTLLITNLV